MMQRSSGATYYSADAGTAGPMTARAIVALNPSRQAEVRATFGEGYQTEWVADTIGNYTLPGAAGTISPDIAFVVKSTTSPPSLVVCVRESGTTRFYPERVLPWGNTPPATVVKAMASLGTMLEIGDSTKSTTSFTLSGFRTAALLPDSTVEFGPSEMAALRVPASNLLPMIPIEGVVELRSGVDFPFFTELGDSTYTVPGCFSVTKTSTFSPITAPSANGGWLQAPLTAIGANTIMCRFLSEDAGKGPNDALLPSGFIGPAFVNLAIGGSSLPATDFNIRYTYRSCVAGVAVDTVINTFTASSNAGNGGYVTSFSRSPINPPVGFLVSIQVVNGVALPTGYGSASITVTLPTDRGYGSKCQVVTLSGYPAQTTVSYTGATAITIAPTLFGMKLLPSACGKDEAWTSGTGGTFPYVTYAPRAGMLDVDGHPLVSKARRDDDVSSANWLGKVAGGLRSFAKAALPIAGLLPGAAGHMARAMGAVMSADCDEVYSSDPTYAVAFCKNGLPTFCKFRAPETPEGKFHRFERVKPTVTAKHTEQNYKCLMAHQLTERPYVETHVEAAGELRMYGTARDLILRDPTAELKSMKESIITNAPYEDRKMLAEHVMGHRVGPSKCTDPGGWKSDGLWYDTVTSSDYEEQSAIKAFTRLYRASRPAPESGEGRSPSAPGNGSVVRIETSSADDGVAYVLEYPEAWMWSEGFPNAVAVARSITGRSEIAFGAPPAPEPPTDRTEAEKFDETSSTSYGPPHLPYGIREGFEEPLADPPVTPESPLGYEDDDYECDPTDEEEDVTSSDAPDGMYTTGGTDRLTIEGILSSVPPLVGVATVRPKLEYAVAALALTHGVDPRDSNNLRGIISKPKAAPFAAFRLPVSYPPCHLLRVSRYGVFRGSGFLRGFVYSKEPILHEYNEFRGDGVKSFFVTTLLTAEEARRAIYAVICTGQFEDGWYISVTPIMIENDLSADDLEGVAAPVDRSGNATAGEFYKQMLLRAPTQVLPYRLANARQTGSSYTAAAAVCWGRTLGCTFAEIVQSSMTVLPVGDFDAKVEAWKISDPARKENFYCSVYQPTASSSGAFPVAMTAQILMDRLQIDYDPGAGAVFPEFVEAETENGPVRNIKSTKGPKQVNDTEPILAEGQTGAQLMERAIETGNETIIGMAHNYLDRHLNSRASMLNTPLADYELWLQRSRNAARSFLDWQLKYRTVKQTKRAPSAGAARVASKMGRAARAYVDEDDEAPSGGAGAPATGPPTAGDGAPARGRRGASAAPRTPITRSGLPPPISTAPQRGPRTGPFPYAMAGAGAASGLVDTLARTAAPDPSQFDW